MSAFEEWQSLSPSEREQAVMDAKSHKRNKKTKLFLAALSGGPFAIAGLLGSTGRSFNGKYQPYQQYNLNKADNKPLPKAQVESMKRKQPKYSEAAAITGLTAATLVGAGLASKKIKRIPVSASIKGKKVNVQYKENDRSKVVNYLADHGNAITNTGYGVGTIGTGIGGFGNLNNARLQRNELHRQQRLKKSDVKPFNPEANRQKRSKNRTPVLISGGAATAAAGLGASKYIGAKQATYAKDKKTNLLWRSKLGELNRMRVRSDREQKLNPKHTNAEYRLIQGEIRNRVKAHALTKPPVPKELNSFTKLPAKRVAAGGIAAGTALAGLGVANEMHRRSKGSRSY